MLKISGPVGAALFVTITLASANTGLLVDSAHADACLAAPKAAAPQGQHWYYHIDRATRHKCWYLHGTVALHHRAMIRHHAAAGEDADPASDSQAAPAPVTAAAPPAPPAGLPVPPAPATDTATGNAPPAPHVTVLTVKTSTPFVSTAPAPQPSTSESPPAPSTIQSPPRGENTPDTAATKPSSGTEAAPQDKAEAAISAPAQTAQAAAVEARTKTAEMFILLALVLGLAAAVTAIISKIVGLYRKPRISVDPDTAWLNFRSERQRNEPEAGYEESDVPFLDPQEQYGLADLHTQEWLDRSAAERGRSSTSRPRNANSTQQSAQSTQPDIEPALRALRQARRSGVPSLR